MEKIKTTKEGDAILSASWYLRGHDYRILDTEWECNFGKVNIVAMDNDCLVFTEVRCQEFAQNGFLTHKVTDEKRKKYENIALAYLVCHDFLDLLIRFDVIDVVKLDDDRYMIKHHVNAFGVVD